MFTENVCNISYENALIDLFISFKRYLTGHIV